MGRKITENNNFVWQYVFAVQPSEQNRIHEEFGLGDTVYAINTTKGLKYKRLNELSKQELDYIFNDLLTLNISDLPALEKILDKNKENFMKAKNIEISYFSKYGSNGTLRLKLYDLMNEEIFNICPNYYFYCMIERFIDYIKAQYENNNRENFTFIGDYY